MFSWGEQSQRGFRFKDDTNHSGDGVVLLDLGCPVTDLSVGLRVLSFVKSNGKAFIIRVNQSKDGTMVRGKQKSVEWKEKIRAVSCTDEVVTLLSHSGQVICVDTSVLPLKPRILRDLRRVTVSQVSCGRKHSVVLTGDGQVFTWGLDSRGQLGLGKRRSGASSPQPVSSLSDLPLVQVAAGGEQSFCLTVSGSVFSWGSNSCGQLGLGDTTDRHTPSLVHHLNMKKSCHISCGETHTAVLTKDGAVFTFGSGQHGQLGHNSFRDELRPRLVAELWGSKVTAVACGRQHTVVLTESQRMYSFGCGAQGQLGRGQDSPAVPLPVQLSHEHRDGPSIRKIFAGGSCSYAACSFQKNDTESSDTDPCLEDLLNKWTFDSEPWKQTQEEILRTCSSASCWNRSFLDHRKHFETSSKRCGLDLSAAQSSFSKLLNKPKVLEEVEAASIRLLHSLHSHPVGVEALRVYLLLTELLHVLHKNKEGKDGTPLGETMAAVVSRLSGDSFHVLGEWWSSLSYTTRVRHVEAWKNSPGFTQNDIKNLLHVLQQMYNINSKTTGPERIPESVFCTSLPTDEIINMLAWHLEPKYKSKLGEPPILCSFPFVMDLKAKRDTLNLNRTMHRNQNWKLPLLPVDQNELQDVLEADLTELDDDLDHHLDHHLDDELEDECEDEFEFEFDDLIYGFFHFYDDLFALCVPRLKLKLRRECVMEDTFTQLAVTDYSDFKKDLEVYFNNITVFDKVNQKDFFHLVFHEMVSAESGMFMFNDSATLAWFSSRATHPLEHYFLFGVLCGLAVFNLHLIFLPFPLALFKKLLGVRPSLDDLCELSPCTGQGLRCLLYEYSDEVIQSLDMDFTIYWDGTHVDLDVNTPGHPVNGQNKEEFVEAYVNHVFNSSVESVFEEFRRGFFQACDLHVVELFSPEELQGVVVGQEFNDWTKFKQRTVYEEIYNASHPTIQMFWEVFDELTEEQRKALLWFVTGFQRVPILSEEKMLMSIRGLSNRQEDLHDDQYYPRSHTCINALELPLYSTKDIMKTKLSEALAQISPTHDETLS